MKIGETANEQFVFYENSKWPTSKMAARDKVISFDLVCHGESEEMQKKYLFALPDQYVVLCRNCATTGKSCL